MEYILVLAVWITTLAPSGVISAREPIHIAGLFPVTGEADEAGGGGVIGRGVLPAVHLAVDHVNTHRDILPNHELRLIYNDTKVSRVFWVYVTPPRERPFRSRVMELSS